MNDGREDSLETISPCIPVVTAFSVCCIHRGSVLREVGMRTSISNDITNVDSVRTILTYCSISRDELSTTTMADKSDVADVGVGVSVGERLYDGIQCVDGGEGCAFGVCCDVSCLPSIRVPES